MTTVTDLPKVEKRYGQTLSGGLGGRTRRECWGARTVDGVWDIERVDDVGTPWVVKHVPTGEMVPLLLGSRVDGVTVWKAHGPDQFASLRKALVWIASGKALEAIEQGRAT